MLYIVNLLVCVFLINACHSVSLADSQKSFFVAAQSCGSNNIANLSLDIGKSYKLINEGNNFVELQLESRNGKFDKSCGEVKNFAPFFSETPKSQYVAPTIQINEFDSQILKLCGDWGKEVKKDDFKSLLAKNPKVMHSIYESMEKTLTGTMQDIDSFMESLSEIWFNHQGFKHIFCGMPEGEGTSQVLGGLHYAPRYLELNEKGYIGLQEKCDKNEVSFPIYTVAVEYVDLNGQIKNKCPNGYHYSISATDILISASKAFKYNNKGSCYYKYTDANSADQYFMFASRDNGDNNSTAASIVTFYSVVHPDFNTTPKCNDSN